MQHQRIQMRRQCPLSEHMNAILIRDHRYFHTSAFVYIGHIALIAQICVEGIGLVITVDRIEDIGSILLAALQIDVVRTQPVRILLLPCVFTIHIFL